MIEMTEIGAAPVSTRSPVLLVVCAVAGLAAVAAAQLNLAAQVWFVGPADYDAPVYASAAVLVVALLAWHRWPRRSWVVLLVVGAVCASPMSVVWLAEDPNRPDWLLTPYLVVTWAALPLLQVGTLGAATASWRAGYRGAGVALLGAVLVVPVSLNFSLARLGLPDGMVVPVIVLVVLAATVAVAIAAAVAGPAPIEPEPRPGWQVTIAGAVAGVAPTILLRVWRGPEFDQDGDIDAYTAEAGQYFLVVGLVLLGVGLLAGAAAGMRVLVTGAAAGLLLGALGSLAYPAARELYDVSMTIPVSLALGGLVVAVVIAVLRARLFVGVVGLGVLIAGLLVVFLNLQADDPFVTFEAMEVLTSVLLVVAVIAAVSTFASLGTALAAAGEAPAAFLGVTAAVTAGSNWVTTYFSYTAPADEPELVGVYPPVLALLAVVVALTLVAHRLWRDSSAPAPVVPG